ncbi:MAG: hypothetical protein COV70_01805 [Parcubacteria group bacterium CG11_big_fil_rev_8_21_14_0_20_39_22]|nr:MAG: hypothetical protein COV70_01805 [Parcubacteria group bacterium CG11_big_fil_rev_8_21_14_0_20_39_22]
MSDSEIKWETHEYRHTEKRADWYWAVSIIGLSFVVVAVMFSSILFAVVILLSTFTLMLLASRKPNWVECSLTQKEVRFGKDAYPYTDLESFWIEDGDGEPRIIFKSRHILSPFIVVPLEGVKTDLVQNHLLNHLEEEEHSEPVLQKMMEWLGF